MKIIQVVCLLAAVIAYAAALPPTLNGRHLPSSRAPATHTKDRLQIQPQDQPQAQEEIKEMDEETDKLNVGRLPSSRALATHTKDRLQIQPQDQPQAQEEIKEIDEVTGRGKMKNMGPLLAAGAMKMGMLGMLAFKALALLVGKALLVAKLAFLLAAIIGLKKLFSQEKHVTYEVVAHPHHSHSHVSTVEGHHGGSIGGSVGGHHGGGDSYSSGWGRSIDVAPVASGDPHQLAYRGQAKQQ